MIYDPLSLKCLIKWTLVTWWTEHPDARKQQWNRIMYFRFQVWLIYFIQTRQEVWSSGCHLYMSARKHNVIIKLVLMYNLIIRTVQFSVATLLDTLLVTLLDDLKEVSNVLWLANAEISVSAYVGCFPGYPCLYILTIS